MNKFCIEMCEFENFEYDCNWIKYNYDCEVDLNA